MHNAPAASAAQPTPDGHDTPDLDLVQRTVAELEEAVRERERTDRAYRDALTSFEAAGEDKAEADAVEAEARRNLVALCFDVVREQAGPDKRLSRFLLCRNDGSGERIVLDANDDESRLRRERDRILQHQPDRGLYLVHEEYVRVASTVRSDPDSP